MTFNPSKKNILFIGILLIFIIVFFLYLTYTKTKAGLILKKQNQIDIINQKYEILKDVSIKLESDQLRRYSEDSLRSYDHTLKSLCTSQKISTTDCSLESLSAENLQVVDTSLSESISELVRIESTL